MVRALSYAAAVLLGVLLGASPPAKPTLSSVTKPTSQPSPAARLAAAQSQLAAAQKALDAATADAVKREHATAEYRAAAADYVARVAEHDRATDMQAKLDAGAAGIACKKKMAAMDAAAAKADLAVVSATRVVDADRSAWTEAAHAVAEQETADDATRAKQEQAAQVAYAAAHPPLPSELKVGMSRADCDAVEARRGWTSKTVLQTTAGDRIQYSAANVDDYGNSDVCDFVDGKLTSLRPIRVSGTQGRAEEVSPYVTGGH